MAQRKQPAVAYLRTSSATNVGADKDNGSGRPLKPSPSAPATNSRNGSTILPFRALIRSTLGPALPPCSSA